MRDADKTKEQLISEVEGLRRRIADLETSSVGPDHSGEGRGERSVREEKVMADLSSQALLGWHFQSLMEAAARLTTETLGVDLCEILKLEETGRSLRLVAGVGWPRDIMNVATVNSGEESLAGYTLVTKEPVVFDDLPTESRFNGSPHLRDHGVVSGLTVPMVAGEFVFGVMGVHTGQRRAFNGEDVHFLKTVANIVTIAFLRKQAVDALGMANKGLVETKGYLESLIETSSDPIISTDRDGRVALCNKAAEDLLGYLREELLGTPVVELYENAEQDHEAMRLLRESSGTLDGYEATLKARDGRLVPVLTSASIFYDDEGGEAGTVRFCKDLRERRRWEEELREVTREFRNTSQHLSALMEAAADPIISTDEQGLVVLFNREAEALLGYRRDEVVGQHLKLLYESEELAEEALEMMRGDGGAVAGFDTVLRAKDGSLVPVVVSSAPIYDEEGRQVGALGYSKDLSERRRTEEQLRKLSQAVEQSASVVVITDEQGDIEYVNPRFTKVTGYFPDEVVGKNPRILKSGIQPSQFYEEMWRTITSGMEWRGEFQNKKKDGGLYWALTTISPIRDPEGNITNFLAVQEDITERKRSETELRKAHEDLQQAHHAVERAKASAIASEKLAALGRLTAGVSHEILNPLNIIMMRLQLMLGDPDTPSEVSRHLHILNDQANRIHKITQDLLYFARQRPPERSLVDLRETAERALNLIKQDLVDKNISVVLKPSPGVPNVRADHDQLQQVILNLLTNARDAMPQGGRLSIGTGLVETDEGRFVELKIGDTGVGIDAENMSKIFEPFFTTKPEGGGTGLGLSICKGIVQAHGGSIWAESETGRGTTMVIRLPLEQA